MLNPEPRTAEFYRRCNYARTHGGQDVSITLAVLDKRLKRALSRRLHWLLLLPETGLNRIAI